MDLRTHYHLHENILFVSCQVGPIVTKLAIATPTSGPDTSKPATITKGGIAPPTIVMPEANSAPASPLTSPDHQLSRITRSRTFLRSQPTIASRESSCRLPCNNSTVHRPTVKSAATRISNSSATCGTSNASFTWFPSTVRVSAWLKLVMSVYSMAIRNIAAVIARLQTKFGIAPRPPKTLPVKKLDPIHALLTSVQQYTNTPPISSAHTTTGDRLPGRRAVASLIQVMASRQPGKHRMSASRAKVKIKSFLCQPICCSKRASFLRPSPTNTPAVPIASRHTIEQSTSNVSCSVSRPCTIWTATPATRHENRATGLVLAEDVASDTVRKDEPSRISTWRPV